MTHFLPQSHYRSIVLPTVVGDGRGYPRVAPTSLGSLSGEVPKLGGSQTDLWIANLSPSSEDPHTLLFSAVFVRVSQKYLNPLIEYYLCFTEGHMGALRS